MGLTMLDMFAGAGGLSRGLEAVGFRAVAAIENNSDAAATYRSNFAGALVLERDASRVRYRQFRGVDLVAGGPPCQPFSTGGLRRGNSDHRDLLPQFVRAVMEIEPRAFLLENVPGLASPAHAPYLARVISPLAARYSLSGPFILDAADFGVPQSRRRMILIGTIRPGFRLDAPADRDRLPASEVLSGVGFGVPNESKIVYAKNPDLRPNPYHGHMFNGGGRPINLDAPAPTILASAGGNKTHFVDVAGLVPSYHAHLMRGGKPRHGTLRAARRITVAESAALQTFPAGMVLVGSRSSQYAQVGNAVPPRLAQAIGEMLVNHLLRSRRRRQSVSDQQSHIDVGSLDLRLPAV